MVMGSTKRHSASALRLLADAAGSPREMAQKAIRLGRILALYAKSENVDSKIQKLLDAGIIDEAPTRLQLVVGSYDMLRFWISPAAAEYYASQGISYTFHQLLRFLDEPASLVDPVGFFSTRDGVIGHLMQVVHANPQYDLELLLGLWEDGLLELEKQIEEMLAGTHPRASSIGAIVEEPTYHARLLEYTRVFRKNPKAAAPPLRDNISKGSQWAAKERTFGGLGTAMRYFCKLPKDLRGALHHLRTVKEFPEALAEPEHR